MFDFYLKVEIAKKSFIIFGPEMRSTLWKTLYLKDLNSSEMKIVVKTLTDNEFTISVKASDSVPDLGPMLQDFYRRKLRMFKIS